MVAPEPPLLLANPGAGGGRGRARLARLQSRLSAWRPPPEIVWSASVDHLEEMARLARAEGRSRVIAAGGDGTVHAVANGLLAGVGRMPELAYLPIGTSGDFGRSLRLPRAPAAVVEGLPEWPARPVDVGRVRLAGGEVRHFLNFANVGLAARVAARVADSRWLPRLGRMSYPLAAAVEAGSARTVVVHMEVDDEPAWSGEVIHLSVANGAYFGGGLRPLGDSWLGSGRLHWLRLGAMGQAAAVRELARALRQRPPAHPSATSGAAWRLRVDGDAPVELDGQLPGRLPAAFDVEAAALNVVSPGLAGPLRGDGGREGAA